ncbi:MAG: SPOR domain-containing protein [Bacteroidota bacterium]|nr:SPOR domain-containing protein [Bacteroidota bacterium]
MKNLVKIIIMSLVLGSQMGFSQSVDEQVLKFIKLIEQGETDRVLTESASLISSSINHPGVLYLQGRLAEDGTEAVKLYQTILDNFPKSDWADDALYNTYQYYYAVGLYRTAELKLAQLRKNYPDSPYLSGKSSDKISEPAKATIPTPAAQPAAIPTLTEPKQTPAETILVRTYTIQVGAFSTLENAEKLRSYFINLNYDVEIANRVRAGKKLFLVWVGIFQTVEEAVKLAFDIKQKYNIEAITVQRY